MKIVETKNELVANLIITFGVFVALLIPFTLEDNIPQASLRFPLTIKFKKDFDEVRKEKVFTPIRIGSKGQLQ